MRKIFVLFVLFLCSCANNNDLVTVLSYEKNTDIYLNNELVGINHTQIKLPDRNVKKAKLYGKKQGCQTAVLDINYEFDTNMLLNPFNLIFAPDKYFAWDWWRAGDKQLYNVTPICRE